MTIRTPFMALCLALAMPPTPGDSGGSIFVDVSGVHVTAVPEPATGGLLLTGLACIGLAARRGRLEGSA